MLAKSTSNTKMSVAPMCSEHDPFMLMRSMMLVEFRCPPMPMTGQFLENGTNTVINSHDLMATLVTQAFKHSDETKNNVRRQIQEALRERYLRELAEHAAQQGSFDSLYAIMTRHTREYIATYLLGTPFSVHDVLVLPPDRITPRIAEEIDHYERALRLVLMAATADQGAGEGNISNEASLRSHNATTVLDYCSQDVVQTLLMLCARSAINYEKEGVVHEPVLKRVCNGVGAE